MVEPKTHDMRPTLSAELKVDLAGLTADLAVLARETEEVKTESARLTAKAVEVSARCDDIMTRIIAENPEGEPILRPLLDGLKASVAELTGRLQ